jgi:hypothetical protein
MRSSRFLKLAVTVNTTLNKIHCYIITERGLPYPSFKPDAPESLPEELGVTSIGFPIR